MLLRVPMMILLSGTFAGGVATTQIAPKIFPDTLKSNAERADKSSLVLPAPAEAHQSGTARDAAAGETCPTPVWPYVDRGCGRSEAAVDKPERQVRVISTDRDAPSRVPIPSAAVAQGEAPAEAPRSGATDTAALFEAPAQTADAPREILASEEDGNGADASVITVLPPRKPAFRLVNAERGPKATLAEPTEPTSGRRPSVAKARVAKVEKPRHDLIERVGRAKRPFEEQGEEVGQTTTYQYVDGRQVVFRSEPHVQDRRRWLAEAPVATPVQVEAPQPRAPHEILFGWLTQSNR